MRVTRVGERGQDWVQSQNKVLDNSEILSLVTGLRCIEERTAEGEQNAREVDMFLCVQSKITSLL